MKESRTFHVARLRTRTLYTTFKSIMQRRGQAREDGRGHDVEVWAAAGA